MCVAGYELNANRDGCDPCPYGSWNNMTGGTCQMCPMGQNTTNTTSTSLGDCSKYAETCITYKGTLSQLIHVEVSMSIWDLE